jgi:hypothetical protein
MKAVKRWRYYCDFCKKSGASSFHMKNHELSCTLNPARGCKCCERMSGNTATPMPEMLALLPDPEKFKRIESWDAGEDFGGAGEAEWPDDAALCAAVHAALPALRELTEDCPVCILAALRQRGIPVPIVTDFNFTKEMERARVVMNGHREEQEYRPSMYGY